MTTPTIATGSTVVDVLAGQNASIKTRLLDWLLRQRTEMILLVGILVANGWFVHYTLTEMLPVHLSQIQSGYERIGKAGNDARQQDASTMKSAVDAIIADNKEERAFNREMMKLDRK